VNVPLPLLIQPPATEAVKDLYPSLVSVYGSTLILDDEQFGVEDGVATDDFVVPSRVTVKVMLDTVQQRPLFAVHCGLGRSTIFLGIKRAQGKGSGSAISTKTRPMVLGVDDDTPLITGSVNRKWFCISKSFNVTLDPKMLLAYWGNP